jgi:cell division protein FtsZ
MTPAVTAPTVEPSVARPAPAENIVPVAAKAPARAAPVQANLDVTERAKSSREDDDLQIPAFLRRQAN